jgi:hypothetical protein
MNNFYNLFLRNNNFQVEFFVRNGLTANYNFVVPNTPPSNNDSLRWNSANGCFEWVQPAVAGGSGTVTSVGLSAPSIFNAVGSTPVTTSGTLALTLANQTGNTVFASPANGSAGTPLFRSIVDADLPSSISASKINGALAKTNIPSGTSATTFQLNTNAGVVLSDFSGTGLKIFDSGGTNLADLYIKNLYISGNVDQTNTTTVNLGDSLLRLNDNFATGTPIENAGLEVRRGSSTNATMLWVESTDDWQAGTLDNLRPVTRTFRQDFVNADLTSGVLTVNHNLGKRPQVSVIDNTGVVVGITTTHTNTNTLGLNLTRVGTLVGTWSLVCEV